MKTETKKWIVFISVNIAIALVSLNISSLLRDALNPEMVSILTRIKRSGDMDIVMMGTSHAQVFAWQKNQRGELIVNMLRERVLHLSSSGLIGEYFFLKQFYKHGKKTKKIVYFIDPAVLYSDMWDKHWALGQPFDLAYCWDVILFKKSLMWLPDYLMAKFSREWFKGLTFSDGVLGEIRSQEIISNIQRLYPNGTSPSEFQRTFPYVVKILELAKNHDAKVYFIIPPTLLGEVPGTDELIAALDGLRKGYEFKVFDCSTVFSEPHLFSDYDHLNARGVDAFCRKYLKPIISIP